MIEFILANLEFITVAVIFMIGACILLFTTYWSSVAFISVMGGWLREDLAEWLRGVWERINR